MESNTENQPVHKRRVRYKGTHPRHYNEKYKELNPEKYGETVEKVIRKGGTPAGMHISIMVQEILDFLQIQPGQRGLDATLGYGGHTSAMLRCLNGEGHLTALDVDAIEIAVKEGHAKAIMSSYNQINGIYANEDKHLLTDILRKEWGFDGIVVTDWGGSNDHVKGVAAGSNLEMPSCGYDSAREVIAAVRNGTLKEADLDERVGELVDAVMELTSGKKLSDKNFDRNAHHQLARKAAAESMILLKNEKQILPLDTKKSIAVIGDFVFSPRYQGAGSSMVNPTKVEDMSSILQQYDLNILGMTRGYQRNGDVDENDRKFALNLAMNADIVIFCFGLDEISESEGLDRTHMRIPQNQIDLLQDISKVNENIIGILSAGSAIEMPWHTCCKAILHGYLNGQAGASATLDILTGKVNPSGRLAETYPISYEQTPAFRYYPSNEKTSEYRESVYVGYRYYDTSKVRVQYPFGFGLSYTEFTYSDLIIEEDGIKVSVTNTGDRDGAEVVQMYVGLPNAIVFRPEKELKGFAKVYLKAGESRQIRIPFDDKTFRYWNIKTGQWETETGTYQIMVGASVADIRLTGMTERTGNSKGYPYNPAKCLTIIQESCRKYQMRNFVNFLVMRYRMEDGVEIWKSMMQSARCIMQKADLQD